MNLQELHDIQKWDLDLKVDLTLNKIKQFYEYFNGKVYVSFSGGKDSTVLLHLVRSIYPEVKAVFSDTGLEYPEIREFVKTTDNVEWIKPKMSFYQVIKKYGYPVVSKEQALYIRQYTTTRSEYLKKVRWEGKNGKFKISDKWKFLVNAPFKVSERCCDILKKRPIKTFERKSGLKPFIGNVATDSKIRERIYLQVGCNSFVKGREKSTPLAFWREEDIWDYIKTRNVPYCSIYDKGLDRTGCIFCLFGINMEKDCRFDVLKKIHPELYIYCMNNLGIKGVIDYMNEHLKKKIGVENQ